MHQIIGRLCLCEAFCLHLCLRTSLISLSFDEKIHYETPENIGDRF